MSICLAGARAEASRRNGARSCGPKTPEGKARSAQNALKHGLRAQKFVVVGNESAREFAALETALVDELAPEGTLQGLLAGRVARAAWRLERAERIESDLFAREMIDRSLGLALIRDCNGARAFDTLLRYRGTALAELWRALRLLKALQAEPAPEVRAAEPAPALPAPEKPIEPESRRIPDETATRSAADEPEAAPQACAAAAGTPADAAPVLPQVAAAVRDQPIEPEPRGNPGEARPMPEADEPAGAPGDVVPAARPRRTTGPQATAASSTLPLAERMVSSMASPSVGRSSLKNRPSAGLLGSIVCAMAAIRSPEWWLAGRSRTATPRF
jgi:hypothetical protein